MKTILIGILLVVTSVAQTEKISAAEYQAEILLTPEYQAAAPVPDAQIELILGPFTVKKIFVKKRSINGHRIGFTIEEGLPQCKWEAMFVTYGAFEGKSYQVELLLDTKNFNHKIARIDYYIDSLERCNLQELHIE